MSARKLRNSWWIDFRFERKRYRRKSPDNTKVGAQAYESLVRQRLARGEPLISETLVEPKFAEFSIEWMNTYVQTNNKPSEQRTKMFTLKNHLVPHFGRFSLKDISSAMVERYKAQKLRDGLSAKTVNNHLIVLSKCLHTAKEWGQVESFPAVKHLKTTSQRLDYLSPIESQQLIENANYPMWREMAFLALRTGLRLGELFGLDWEDVDFKRKQIAVQRSIVNGIVGTPKSGKARYVPLTDEVCRAIYPTRRAAGLLFARADGSPLSHRIASNAIRQMCKRAGIRSVSWHVLRHTFASQLASRGVSLTVIKELLGHSTIAMTMRYAHLAPSTLREAVRVLEDRVALDNDGLGNRWATAPDLEPFLTLPTGATADGGPLNTTKKPPRS